VTEIEGPQRDVNSAPTRIQSAVACCRGPRPAKKGRYNLAEDRLGRPDTQSLGVSFSGNHIKIAPKQLYGRSHQPRKRDSAELHRQAWNH
jgi:hypothetical protein